MRGYRDEREGAQLRFSQKVFDLELDQLNPFRVINQIDFAENDDDVVDSQQLKDCEMLARLRHNAFVSGDDKQGGVDSADAGQHILDEVSVTGDIHNADGFTVRQVEPGET